MDDLHVLADRLREIGDLSEALYSSWQNSSDWDIQISMELQSVVDETRRTLLDCRTSAPWGREILGALDWISGCLGRLNEMDTPERNGGRFLTNLLARIDAEVRGSRREVYSRIALEMPDDLDPRVSVSDLDVTGLEAGPA